MITGQTVTVTEAATAAWTAFGESPEMINVESLGFSDFNCSPPLAMLRLNSTRCVEAYLEDDHLDLSAVTKFILSLVNPGWYVTVVVPLRRMGEAHEEFRAIADEMYLQAWWRDESGIVRFSACERP